MWLRDFLEDRRIAREEARLQAIVDGLRRGTRYADRALDAIEAMDGKALRSGGREAANMFLSWFDVLKVHAPDRWEMFVERFEPLLSAAAKEMVDADFDEMTREQREAEHREAREKLKTDMRVKSGAISLVFDMQRRKEGEAAALEGVKKSIKETTPTKIAELLKLLRPDIRELLTKDKKETDRFVQELCDLSDQDHMDSTAPKREEEPRKPSPAELEKAFDMFVQGILEEGKERRRKD